MTMSDDKLGKMSLEQTMSTVEIRERALRSLANVRTPVKAASAETPKTGVKSDPRLKKDGKCDKCSKSMK